MGELRKIGKYEIAEQIGMGGFGVVYKAWDPFIQRWVALKTCNATDPETTQRFFREAQLAGNLQHPNITLIYDFGVENDTPYFVQEFLSGIDLDELMSKGRPSLPSLLAILLQVCAGLEYAHARGVIHRDIKPGNIRILEDGSVKIMDFGIAKSVQAESHLTQTGVALGTAGYLSPEQLAGKTIDHRCDIFSLGVMTYELVTGVRPFAGPNISNIIFQILNQDPVPPRQRNAECPERLERAILTALAKDPNKRFASVRSLAREFAAVLQTLTPESVRGESTTAIVRRELSRLEGKPSLDITSATQLAAASIDHAPTITTITSSRRRLLWPLVAGAGVIITALGYLALVPASHKENQETTLRAASPPTPIPPPATPTPTKPALLAVELLVDPPAEVEIDGRSVGRVASAKVELPQGPHTFRFRIPGFLDRTETVEVSAEQPQLAFNLPRFGILNVIPDLGVPFRGTQVFLDDTAIGELPITSRKVAVGSHRVQVTWPEGASFEALVEVNDAAPTNLVAHP